MIFTQHFDIAQLTASAKARELGLENRPPNELLPNLHRLAEMLQRIRDTLNVPVIVTSGYRSEAVNKAVGGTVTSDHVRGNAADFVAPRYGTPYQIAKTLAPLVSTLGIGQIIYEKSARGSTWVHVSTIVPIKSANRVITWDGRQYELGIQDA